MGIEHKDIAAIREDYTKGSLSEKEVDRNPIQQFLGWFDQAIRAEVKEPNAMVLSTISTEGFPSSRVVLMKDIKDAGISFFTNYESSKSIEIADNPRVSVLFFWAELQRQVRIEAIAEKLEDDESTEYFQSRPKGSQIGAWASPQSRVIQDRKVLEDRVSLFEEKFKDINPLPRPDYWGGFLLRPVKFEFWQGRASRLHDRIEYLFQDGEWKINRLAP